MKITLFFIVLFIPLTVLPQEKNLGEKLKNAGLVDIIEKIKKAGLEDRTNVLNVMRTEVVTRKSSVFEPDFVVFHKTDSFDAWFRITLDPPDSLSKPKSFDSFFESRVREISIVTENFPFFGLLQLIDEKERKNYAKKSFNADFYSHLGFAPKPELGNYPGGGLYYMIYKKREALVEIMMTHYNKTKTGGHPYDWLRFAE